MTAGPILNFDRTRLAQIADGLVMAVAASLPWSTSASAILIVLWLLTLIPTLDWNDVRRKLATPAGGLPVLLVLLGALGMLWADVGLFERWKGLDSFLKLLVIPLLLVQFRHSERGLWVFGSYLLSCVVLWAVSTIVFAYPAMPFLELRYDHVLVKNAATQSGEFVTCIFGLLFLAVESFNLRRWLLLFGLLAIALGMSASIFYVAIGRTSLIIIPVLLVLFAIKKLNASGIAILFACAILTGIAGWLSSPYLRGRTIDIWTEIQKYEVTEEANSSGERIQFWKKSATFVREAPVIGHGTGSIHSLFIASSVGQSGAAASTTTNPHNQTFAVAIQLGLIGAALLWAMWIAHLLLLRGNGLAEWIGFVVVVQNVVGSLFNSHLFDFVQGWVYVFGVGVAGGMALKLRAQADVDTSARSP
jgi:O-antigen ligase